MAGYIMCVVFQEFEYEDCDALCDSLKSLATDGNKHRAKNDRRKQRSIFREVLHYIEVKGEPQFMPFYF